MSEKIFLIGNDDFISTKFDISTLPVKNLPMAYFPFYHDTQEASLAKIKQLVSLDADISEVVSGSSNCPVLHTKTDIDTDRLFEVLTRMEYPYQPFNNNNSFHINIAVICIWIIILMIILKVCAQYMRENYTYFILFMIFVLLVVSSIWSLLITSKSF